MGCELPEEDSQDDRPIVLVVEYEAVTRLATVDFLRDAGFEALEAWSTVSAVDILASRSDVRVVFTDIDMPPGPNGLGLADVVAERWSEIAIVVASGKQCPGTAELPAGATFLPKPYEPGVVVETIRRLLG